MIRKIYDTMKAWKESPNRKPMVLRGARQIGKTYIANMFGVNEYANVVYCNFEKEEGLKELFTNLTPSIILRKLSAYKRKEILPGHTLVIFDEVQSCPQALTSLKYFCEEANEYHVIATGSLLGVSVYRQEYSFPVGKVDFVNMYPMDFEEFLLANDEAELIKEIRDCYAQNAPLAAPFHERALDYYKTYLFVGGMPEVVDEYVKTKNFDLVQLKQQAILDAYFNDMGMYNRSTEIPKTKLVYQNISTQLSKENRKFQYKYLKSGARASAYEDAIEWLCLAGIANRLYRLENIEYPLEAHKSLSDFKFYMNDVGLCCASQNVLFYDIYSDNNSSEFRGGITENYVNNQLNANGFRCYYWTSKSDAEVDFVTRIGEDIIPIEVKSSTNVRSRSLLSYVTKYSPTYSIRISARNFGFENGIKSVPLYAVFCIECG